MEDVLDLYAQPYDPAAPLVCFDEKPLVGHGEIREPLPVKPGYPHRSDSEYERLGTANLFLFVEPLAGRRCVEMTDRRTRLDFASTIRWLVDEVYPDARVIRLVMDNLNTHRVSSLYEAFPPEEAQRLWKRLEVHYTPKHGSWLNMAEIEISIFERGGCPNASKAWIIGGSTLKLWLANATPNAAVSIGALPVLMLVLKCMSCILRQKSNWTDY